MNKIQSDKKGLHLVVITDVHFGDDNQITQRRCSIGDILLERAVRRINTLIKPEVVLVLGDLTDNGSASDTEERLLDLRKILAKLSCPYIVIPGNHDGDDDLFYRVFNRPGEFTDVAGARFLAFIDQEEPGCNAYRSAAELQRFYKARADFNGPLIALQHVCLYPTEPKRAPYNYTNADDILKAMKEAGVALSISGHHHHGVDPVEVDGTTLITAPGLCEAPFPLLEITLDNGRVNVKRHELAMPRELNLVDRHLHTQLAYCSENMDVKTTIALAHEFGLAGLVLTEHSGHLYYDRDPYWRSEWLTAGIEGADPKFNRMAEYLALKASYEDAFTKFGLEVDIDERGQGILTPADARQFDYLMGAIHALPGLSREAPPTQKDINDFLFLVDKMGASGMKVLAHPFRIFRRCGWDTPPELFEATAAVLMRHGMAAEINYHTNNPAVEFVQHCLNLEVKFTFGSDSHHLAEIGDFAPHMDLLKRAGYDGDLRDILLDL